MTSTNFNHPVRIATAVAAYKPPLIQIVGQRQAAVALIMREIEDEAEILFIQRASSSSDPWSGQIAFPGGGMEQHDPSLTAAAIRETAEEVGVALTESQQRGRLDDIQGRNNNRSLNLVISCFVFSLESAAEIDLQPNYEVAEAFWTPLSTLTDPAKAIDYVTSYRQQPFPAINLGCGSGGQERILWGLTYRFVHHFLGAAGYAVKAERFD